MRQIENDLKAALRRKPAPPGFAGRVLERIEDNKFARNSSRRFLPGRSWMLAAAALAVMMVGAVVFEYQRYIRNRNEKAFQNTLAAISIATVQLNRAESKAFEPGRWDRLSKQLAGFEVNDKR